ncbi:unnamed protein product [Ixodes persulcatus]
MALCVVATVSVSGRMRTANSLKSRAENSKTFAGYCLTMTSLMNRIPLFPLDDRDGLLLLTLGEAGSSCPCADV